MRGAAQFGEVLTALAGSIRDPNVIIPPDHVAKADHDDPRHKRARRAEAEPR